MSTEIDTTRTAEIDTTGPDAGVHRAGEVSRYSQEQRDELRALMDAGEASDGDVRMLETVAARTGLDPFARQLYIVGRRTKKSNKYRGGRDEWITRWTVQTGIDGFRAVTRRYADARGKDVNIERPVFYDDEGNSRPIWLKKWGNPSAVEVTIRLGGSSAIGIATWDEYVQTTDEWKNGEKTGRRVPNSMWAQMPSTMLKKCAEAQAHRQICPLTAGLYEPAEMAHLDRDTGLVKAESTRIHPDEQNPPTPAAIARPAADIAADVLAPDATVDTIKDLWREARDAGHHDLKAAIGGLMTEKVTEADFRAAWLPDAVADAPQDAEQPHDNTDPVEATLEALDGEIVDNGDLFDTMG